ncbi:PREDICTED: uncharacterized protein LOC109154282 [Ipomoea nil]|uniref:uncharacterized protein LOC109154282 n=1 Tax=Ipomoea nil TaxID=35883 RepID=UPI000901183D|nr:PREDICTED: uncharacterized protein LOC109154282 [Ipomoea nil]
MVRTRNQRKGKIPRRGVTDSSPQYTGTGAPSNPLCIEEESPNTVFMDPVPISQVPFNEIQEQQDTTPGNLNLVVDLNEGTTNPLPTAVDLGDNIIQDPNDDLCQLMFALKQGRVPPNLGTEEESEGDSQPSPMNTGPPIKGEEEIAPISDRELRKRKRIDHYEGADPRAKKPSDFPERVKTRTGNQEKGKRKSNAKEKGKQKVVGSADLSKLPKPHNTTFLRKESVSLWKKIVEKKVISQKLLIIDKLDNFEQIQEILISNQLLGTVTNIEPYDEQVIQEFYCNLTKNTTTPSSPMYGKVYLRGKFYEFRPNIINSYLGTTETEQCVQVTSEQVAQELTAGNIALVNWMPSLHLSTVKWTLAELLYKIGKGIKFNLGTIIHSKITNLAENTVTNSSIIFPNLIFAILTKQGLKTHGPKTQVNAINTTMKLKKGGHRNDLKNTVPKNNSTDQKNLINYFERRLTELQASEKHVIRMHMDIKEEKSEVLQWLKALKPEVEEENEEDNEEEEGQEEEDQEDESQEDVETSGSTASS